jgi:single-stranded-DNA-specific exonuclease
VATEHQAIAMLTGTRAAERPAIVLADAYWHHGVMGIVATRLAERFRKPVLLFAKEEGGYWRGSGRSALGLDVHAILEELSDHLGRYGGHASAVGATVAEGGLDGFIEAFQQAVGRRGATETPAPKVWEVDAEVPLIDLSYESVAGLHVLQPTGPDNPAPVLAARNLMIRRQETRGPEGEHLFLELEDTSGWAEAIGFGMGALHPLGVALVDIVFVPMAERWQGRNRLTLKLLEIKPSFMSFKGTGPLNMEDR